MVTENDSVYEHSERSLRYRFVKRCLNSRYLKLFGPKSCPALKVQMVSSEIDSTLFIVVSSIHMFINMLSRVSAFEHPNVKYSRSKEINNVIWSLSGQPKCNKLENNTKTGSKPK